MATKTLVNGCVTNTSFKQIKIEEPEFEKQRKYQSKGMYASVFKVPILFLSMSVRRAVPRYYASNGEGEARVSR